MAKATESLTARSHVHRRFDDGVCFFFAASTTRPSLSFLLLN